MRKLVLFSSIFILGCFVSAQQNTIDAVQQTIKNAFDAMAVLDGSKLKTYFTAENVILENDAVWSTDTLATRLNVRKGIADFKRVNAFDFRETKFEGNTAWTYCYNTASVTANGKFYKIKWLESAVLVKESAG